MRNLPYLISFLTFPILFVSIKYYLWYILPLYSLIFVPLMDFILPKQKPLSEQQIEELQEDDTFEYLLFVWSFVYFICQIWCYFYVLNLNYLQIILASFVSGFLSSQSFAVSHEILHKQGTLKAFWAHILLLMNSYLHFYKAHKIIHHVHIGTEDDPSSAPKGMTVYQFVPKSIFGNLKILLFKQPLMLCFCTLLSCWYGYTLYSFHFKTFLFWILQTMVAIVLVEMVNYIEHYGVERVGTVSDRDSWDCYYPFMNWILFRIGYHSQHHQSSKDKYQVLNETENSLKLPFDYPMMMLCSLYPRLYFYLTHSKLRRD